MDGVLVITALTDTNTHSIGDELLVLVTRAANSLGPQIILESLYPVAATFYVADIQRWTRFLRSDGTMLYVEN